jgi:RecB family exonuclease
MGTYKPALSPSRAKDYKQCPLKFRFAVVDRRPTKPTEATAKGTLVHAVLEELFQVPPAQRTLEYASEMVASAWQTLISNRPETMTVITGKVTENGLLEDAKVLLAGYFQLERPQNLKPFRCEGNVQATLTSGLRLRGIIDRIDQAPNGALRVIDYKTGKAPSNRFIDEALFQMRFYALLLQETESLPARMQLLYLKSGQVLTLDPTKEDINAFENEINLLWENIKTDLNTDGFKPKTGPLCNWCDFKPICPAFGGETERADPADLERVLAIQDA